MEAIPFNTSTPSLLRRGIFGVIIGFLATAVNVLLLQVATMFHIVTVKGGLFRLLKQAFLTASAHVSGNCASLLQWSAHSLLCNQAVFHWITGIGMALLYTIGIAPHIYRAWLRAALGFAAIIWFFNSLMVLPILGEGFAGSHTLNMVGMFAFAVAHFSFFLVLAWLVDRTLFTTQARLHRENAGIDH